MVHKVWTWILRVVLAPILILEYLSYCMIAVPLGLILAVRAFMMGENYTREEERNDEAVFEFISEDFRFTHTAYEIFSTVI